MQGTGQAACLDHQPCWRHPDGVAKMCQGLNIKNRKIGPIAWLQHATIRLAKGFRRMNGDTRN